MQKQIATFLFLVVAINCCAQELDFPKIKNNYSGLFSLGSRITLSSFNDDKSTNLGLGGDFKIQISERVTTNWFADYLPSGNVITRKQDFHIGWSVMYFLAENNKRFQPYILAGHCFDFSRLSERIDVKNTNKRWSSAIQGGAGLQINCSNRVNLNLTCQLMGHLGKELEEDNSGPHPKYTLLKVNQFEGHLLSTFGITYKIADLW
jgi:hypothetical protein